MSLRQAMKNGRVTLGYQWVSETRDGQVLHYAEARCAKSGISERILFHHPAPPEVVAKKFREHGWQASANDAKWRAPARLASRQTAASPLAITSAGGFTKASAKGAGLAATAMAEAMLRAERQVHEQAKAKGGGFTPAQEPKPAPAPEPAPAPAPEPAPLESTPMQHDDESPAEPALPFLGEGGPTEQVLAFFSAHPLETLNVDQVAARLPTILPGSVNGALVKLAEQGLLDRVKLRRPDQPTARAVWYYSRSAKPAPASPGPHRRRAVPQVPHAAPGPLGPVTIRVLGRDMTLDDARALYTALRAIFEPQE